MMLGPQCSFYEFKKKALTLTWDEVRLRLGCSPLFFWSPFFGAKQIVPKRARYRGGVKSEEKGENGCYEKYQMLDRRG